MEGANVTFKNVRIQDRLTNANYRGFVRTANMTFENCVFTARESYWGVGNVTFKNCTFEDTGDWNLWCYSGKNFTFINCEFKSSKKGNINLYQEHGTNQCDVYIENCSFTLNSETSIDKPAVQVGEDNGDTNIFSVEFSDATINGNYAVGSFQNYPKYILNKNSKSEAKLRIIIDDVKIYGN